MVSIQHDENRSRYEAFVDAQPAGICQYEAQAEQVRFTHTLVEPAFEGEGVGSALARFALEDSRARGKKVVPACGFIRDYIGRHAEFADLLAR
ncbi:MAG: N-acetyltransferase [Polaromonas sp.]|nr:N-acetyltransferase [Polaromonas sp.]